MTNHGKTKVGHVHGWSLQARPQSQKVQPPAIILYVSPISSCIFVPPINRNFTGYIKYIWLLTNLVIENWGTTESHPLQNISALSLIFLMPRREVQMMRMKKIWFQNLKRTAVLDGPGLAPVSQVDIWPWLKNLLYSNCSYCHGLYPLIPKLHSQVRSEEQ